jgi:hypothetical protein
MEQCGSMEFGLNVNTNSTVIFFDNHSARKQFWSSHTAVYSLLNRGASVCSFRLAIPAEHCRSTTPPIFAGKIMKRKNANLIYEAAIDVRFGHKLANREFWIMKLPSMSVLFTP